MSEVRKRAVISVAEVKEILEKLDPEEADQIQKRTLDYVTKFSKIDAEQARAIRARLLKECGLSEGEATELVNIAPKSIEELRVFTVGWKKLLSTEVAERILSILRGRSGGPQSV